MTRFVLVFTAVLLGLFTLELLEPVQAAVIQPFTGMLADLSARLMMLTDDHVRASGRIISHSQTGFAVSIEAGCNGVEATIVLVAGVLAFPAAARDKLLAIAVGFIAIQLLNTLRIISLFYLGQWNVDVFTWTHLYLWPVLIMLDVLIVFVLYLRYLARGKVFPARVEPAAGRGA
ncbi:MAG: exosortase H [Pseudomonadota bacterium]